MSMGTKLPSGMFNTGYTPPYGSGSAASMYGGGYGGGTYDPMLGFGQSSGMGTAYDYPTRYSADYTRYAQSGQPFNQPVMGYNTYGQIFAQPQRPAPSFGGKGGGGFGGFRPPQPPSFGGKGRVSDPGISNDRPRYGARLPSAGGDQIDPNAYRPTTIGGKGGPKPENDGVTISYPGGSRTVPRFPQRRSNQLGLNQPPKDTGVSGSFLDFYSRQNKPANPYEAYPTAEVPQYGGPGPTPPPLTGGVPTDFTGNFTPVQANRQVIDENIYNSPFSQLIGTGVNRPPVGDTMFDTRAFENFRLNQDFGRMNFQEGGQVPPDANMEMMMAETAQPEMAGEYDRLIQMTMQAILGQVESPDEVIQMFIDEFGVDAFRQLRDAVLKQQVPNAQTEGMVDGNGGGMDDQVMGMIGNQRPVAVSPGEYIVPADVVSGLGDGSSKSGADILDELNQAVRMARTGTTQQPRPLMETMQ